MSDPLRFFDYIALCNITMFIVVGICVCMYTLFIDMLLYIYKILYFMYLYVYIYMFIYKYPSIHMYSYTTTRSLAVRRTDALEGK